VHAYGSPSVTVYTLFDRLFVRVHNLRNHVVMLCKYYILLYSLTVKLCRPSVRVCCVYIYRLDIYVLRCMWLLHACTSFTCMTCESQRALRYFQHMQQPVDSHRLKSKRNYPKSSSNVHNGLLSKYSVSP